MLHVVYHRLMVCFITGTCMFVLQLFASTLGSLQWLPLRFIHVGCWHCGERSRFQSDRSFACQDGRRRDLIQTNQYSGHLCICFQYSPINFLSEHSLLLFFQSRMSSQDLCATRKKKNKRAISNVAFILFLSSIKRAIIIFLRFLPQVVIRKIIS